jgi:16S rRNA (guanine1207-N2)-methyltransferase
MTQKTPGSEHYFSPRPKSAAKLGLIRTRLRGVPFEFLTSSSVFSKKRVDAGTRLLVENMVLPKSGCVLDVGCGYGAVGIAAAAFNPNLKVFLTDVNMRAVRLAQENITRNRIANAETRWGYLYEPVEGLSFGCILSNPPVSAGMETVKAIITEAPKVMTRNGTLQMVVRSKISGKILPSVFESVFGNCTVLSRESGYRVLKAQKQQ